MAYSNNNHTAIHKAKVLSEWNSCMKMNGSMHARSVHQIKSTTQLKRDGKRKWMNLRPRVASSLDKEKL